MSPSPHRHAAAGGGRIPLVLAAIFLSVAPDVDASTAGDIVETSVWDQAWQFITFEENAVRIAVVGGILLGICCGLIGSFVVVRKLALAGDAISHAILPGIAVGYLWTLSKNPVALFIGAVSAGLLGSLVVSLITRTSRIKQDAALGIVLAGFFAAGLVLIDRINVLPSSGKSGLKDIYFGSTAGMGWDSIVLIGAVTLTTFAVTLFLYKQLLATSFDPSFARSLGIPERAIHHGLMLLLAFTVVVAVQAVGVVLVSAMLIIPPSTAYLLTDRMHRLLIISSIVGMVSAVSGIFLSYLDNRFPTGAFIVIASGFLFVLAFLFAPRHGVVKRWLFLRRRKVRTARENTLKAMFHVIEENPTIGSGIPITKLAERRNVTREEAAREAADLIKSGMALGTTKTISFSDRGWERACEIVRNHRLWELYLTNAADIAPDHVHDDAEKIEHILGEDVVRELEKRLNFSTVDPHGRPIPGEREIEAGAPG